MFRFNTFENFYLLHLPALEYENRGVSANNTIKFMFRPSFRFAWTGKNVGSLHGF